MKQDNALEQGSRRRVFDLLTLLGLEYPRSKNLFMRIIAVSSYLISLLILGIKEILSRFIVELGALEDAYITSRYVPREYTREEFERLRKTVDEVFNIVGGVAGRRS